MKESWSRGVYRAREQHESVGEDVRGEAQDGVPVNARMFEVDPRGTVGGNDYLQLSG